MPRTDTRYRAVIDMVREYFTLHDVWPKYELFRDYMYDRTANTSKNNLTKLSKGWALPEKVSMGLVSMLRDPKWTRPGATTMLHDCLAELGVEDPEVLNTREIFELITGKVYDRAMPPGGQVDYLMEGAWQSLEVLKRKKRLIWRQSRACLPVEIPAAIGWMQVNIAHALAGEEAGDDITLEEAGPIAEKHMGVSAADYTRRVTEWHAWNPLLFRLARGPKYPCGCTCVLPLTPEAYEAVRNGEKASYECGPDDFQLPSRHLLVEICAERLASQQVETCNTTLPLMASIHLQLSLLSAIHAQPRGTLIHLLSFAATSLARQRLAKQGFKPTGAVMPRSGVKIMERTFSTAAAGGLEAATVMWFMWLHRVTPAD